MNKIEEWLQENSIKRNENLIIKILEDNNIKNHNIITNSNGDYGISFNYKNKNYRIEIDIESMSYKLFGKNTVGGIKEKHRYHLIKSFLGDNNLMYNLLDFIKNRNSTGYRLLN